MPNKWNRYLIYLSKYRVGIIGIIVCLVAYLLLCYNTLPALEMEQSSLSITEPLETTMQNEFTTLETQEIIVEIKGAIARPGIYEMRKEDRIFQLIQKAGGFSSKADGNAVNQAQILTDQASIYIPAVGEVAMTSVLPETESSAIGSSVESIININQANQAELESLNGIGPGKAQAIIDYREGNGGFSNVEEIMSVDGIGEKTFEKIKDFITVG